MTWAAVAIGAGALIGGIAGNQSDKTTSSTQESSKSEIWLKDFKDLQGGQSDLEKNSYNQQLNSFGQLSNLVNAGPGQQAVTDGNNAGTDYANLLKSYIQNNGLANSSQQSYAQNYAQNMFAPQQLALNQSFTDQNQQGARLAARLGRSSMDPVLRNKLGVEQTRQQQMLSAQQGAFAAQTADGMPAKQLGMADSLFNVRQNLATQAFNNRQTLMTLGNQLTASERQYRLSTATRTGSSRGFQEGVSGGGASGSLNGIIAGAGTGASMGMGGGGGGGAPGFGSSGGGGGGRAVGAR